MFWNQSTPKETKSTHSFWDNDFLRGHNWLYFVHRPLLYCYFEFKLRYLKNLKLFSSKTIFWAYGFTKKQTNKQTNKNKNKKTHTYTNQSVKKTTKKKNKQTNKQTNKTKLNYY